MLSMLTGWWLLRTLVVNEQILGVSFWACQRNKIL